MSKKYVKRLSLDIPLEVHKELKMMSAKRNISMLKYVLRALLKALREEIKYQ